MADEEDVVDETIDETVDDTADADDTQDDADDTANDAADDADDTQDDAAGQSSPSRRESRTQKLANENRELREKLARTEGEASALRKPQQPVDDGAAKRVREEKLALMEPSERAAFEAKEEAAATRQDMRRLEIQMMDSSDRAAYDAKAATNPVYAKHRDAIEQFRAKEFAAGRIPASRELCLKVKIGDDALKAKPRKQTAADKAAAADRVARSKGTPQSARTDTAGKSGKNDPDSLEAITSRIHAEERRRGLRD